METMATLGERISLCDAKAMIAEVDSDGDKEINYEGTTCWRHGDGDKEINYEGTTRWRHGDGDKEINYEGTTRWRHALLGSV